MNNRKLKPIVYSIALILVVLIHNVFGIFIETATGLFYSIIVVVMVLGLIAFIVYSFVAILVDKKFIYFILIISSIVGITMIFQQTFRYVGVDMEYKMHLKDRQKIVQMFNEGKFKYDEFTMYVDLPKEYKYLSKSDGQVMLETRNKQFKLGFVITQTLFLRQVVIIYSRDDDGLNYNDFGEEVDDVRKIADHWYQATAVVMK